MKCALCHQLFKLAQSMVRPRSLPRQILFVTGTVMVVVAILIASIALQRLHTKNQANLESQMLALARSTASATAQYMLTNDLAGLEQTLLNIGKFPSLTQLVVLNNHGKVIAKVMVNPQTDQLQVDYQPQTLSVPINLLSNPITTTTNPKHRQAWQKIDPKSDLGWMMVEFNLNQIEATQRQILREAIWGTLGLTLITITVLWFFLKRALRPLQRTAVFAGQLDHQIGTLLEQDNRSDEVEELTNALNSASTRLHRQLKVLQETEARTHAILATAADPVIGLDEQGRIVMGNPAVTSIFGIDANQILHQPISKLIPELNPQKLREMIENGIFASGSGCRVARFETWGCRDGDLRFPIEVTLGESKNSGNLCTTCIVRDISEKRHAEEFMRLFSRALDCSNNGVVISDMSYPHQPIVYANPAFTLITGYELSDVIGNNCRFLQGKDIQQPELEKLRNAIANGHECTVTLRNYRKDGGLFWNELSVAPVRDQHEKITHYVGIQIDITERIEAELALEERTERLNTIFSLSPDGFVLFDHRNRLAYVNQAFMLMTGLTERDLLNINQSQFDQLLRQQCDNASYIPSSEWLISHSGSQTVTLIQPERRHLACQIKQSAGANDQTILFFRDITRESEVDRMKSEFLSTAAHELRTPMASLFGFTELMLKRKYSEERQRDMLETMHRQAGLLINLINELLDLARIESRQGKDFKISPQAITPLIEETIASLVVRNDNRKIKVNIEHNNLLAQIDPEKTRHALTNVISNAYKYSPNGGAIELHVAQAMRDEQPWVKISVSDHGIGMTTEQLARVFERFYRADPSGNIPGTGLGLCLVKEIIELQSGQVEIASTYGEGTTATLWLPLAAAEVLL